MSKGTKVRFKSGSPSEHFEVIHVGGERTTLRNYVYLGLPWAWQRIEDLEPV